MKFQVIQHLKTKSKSKLLKMCDSLIEAKGFLTVLGARYEGISYYGGFPTFSLKNKKFSIQGVVMLDSGDHLVCSLENKDVGTLFDNQ